MGNLNIKADGKGESYSVLAKENRTDDVEGERGKGRKGWQWHNKENGIAKKPRYWVQRSPALSRRWIRYRPSSGTQWMLNLLIVKSHWGIKRTLSSVLVFVLQNKPLSPPFVPPPPPPAIAALHSPLSVVHKTALSLSHKQKIQQYKCLFPSFCQHVSHISSDGLWDPNAC